MQLDRHLERLRDRLSLAADTGSEPEARAAQRLIAALDDSVQLMLLDVLAAAAAEITRELAPGSVELRLRGTEPEFVVTTPALQEAPGATDASASASASGLADEPLAGDAGTPGEGALARINLRLPEQLKARVEQAAEREGLSINAWLVRAVAAVIDRGRSDPVQAPRGSSVQHYKGWGR
ncbi:MAG TPA: toxin-antitoxin system HicB family antitoxin [Solirubrobacteraceae bacterium]|nr:toxin-antitoxin system HicB family antitoxin [Solirubrobacteraceae bacterium]